MRNFGLLICLVLITGVASPCDEDHSHDFDFWLGSWKVFNGDQYAGINIIDSKLNGCVLQENWTGATGGSGTSLNFYNPTLKKWQQNWVWANGSTVTFTGGLVGKNMVLSANRKNAKGEPFIQKITWTPHPDGTVQQKAEGSKDDGKTWQTLYDFTYKPKDS